MASHWSESWFPWAGFTHWTLLWGLPTGLSSLLQQPFRHEAAEILLLWRTMLLMSALKKYCCVCLSDKYIVMFSHTFSLEFYCAYFNYPRFLFWWTVIILSSVKMPTHELTWRCTFYDLDPAHSDDVNCVKFLHCGVALVSSSSFLLYNCKWKNHFKGI